MPRSTISNISGFSRASKVTVSSQFSRASADDAKTKKPRGRSRGAAGGRGTSSSEFVSLFLTEEA